MPVDASGRIQMVSSHFECFASVLFVKQFFLFSPNLSSEDFKFKLEVGFCVLSLLVVELHPEDFEPVDGDFRFFVEQFREASLP